MLDAHALRRRVLGMVMHAGSGHIGGSFSMAELTAALYSVFDLTTPDSDRDRLILSKGHAVPIIYAALCELGLIDADELKTFRQLESRLQGHPDHRALPLLDATTGSLGQGLSIAIGHALAHRMRQSTKTIICVMGDGEMQEGQVWEAVMFAPKYELDNLICVVDRNGGQNDGRVDGILPLGDLAAKFKAFGWDAAEIDGQDVDALESKFTSWTKTGKPRCLIMNTVKGAGVSFMEGNNAWHSKVPTQTEYDAAIEELSE